MKNLFNVLFFALISLNVLTGCDDDDNPVRVSESLKNTFYAQFPNATRVEWEMKRGYCVAEFWDSAEMETWYNSNGSWCMTETDLGRSVNQLPKAVQEAFQASEYNQWKVDDLDKYERPDMTFYKVEVESAGKRDRNLFYAEDGILLKNEEEKNKS